MKNINSSEYKYYDQGYGCAHKYLLPALEKVLAEMSIAERRVFDLGCGNGQVAHWLTSRGFRVCGVDPSQSGIAIANKAYPDIDLRVGSSYDSLHGSFGKFPLVLSLEVVEHVYSPREYVYCVQQLLEPNGYALISTPYHGYFKNLALALTGKFDAHFTALWDHGHIKFWSQKTITSLLTEAGLEVVKIVRVGRIPPLAKTMLILAQLKNP